MIEIEIDFTESAFIGDGMQAAVRGKNRGGENVEVRFPSGQLPAIQKATIDLLGQF